MSFSFTFPSASPLEDLFINAVLPVIDSRVPVIPITVFHLSLTIVVIHFLLNFLSFSSVTQSCPTLCDPITNFQSLPKLMSIESVMPSNHLILCCPLLFLPSIFPSIRVFPNESALHIRWPKYWSFSFNISPSSEHSGLISFRINWLDLLSV